MAEVAPNSFADITERLDEIISVVRSKDTSLERSLDLYDEAIELGSRAAELVDSFDLSPEEAAQLDQAARADDSSLDATAQDGSGSASDAGADAAPPTE
ncbi:exodeoxyribonuclease VII small subunit [Enorma massiliensis]|uniref:exodeoxyribonuclease VII small subunit n=1 Tax=Enorma massiliensis TaxID=1472761 RepID=UPI0034A5BB41